MFIYDVFTPLVNCLILKDRLDPLFIVAFVVIFNLSFPEAILIFSNNCIAGILNLSV